MPKLEINERFIKIGKLPVSLILELGTSVEVKVNEVPYTLICVKIEEKDNQDGSKDMTYVMKNEGL